MKAKQKIAALILLGIFTLASQAQAQMDHKPADHSMIQQDDIKWADGPPGLPAGAKFAVIDGDPRAAGIFTMRAKLPANYKVMPHSHPAEEHVTIIEGTGYMGVGNTFNEKAATKLKEGAFAVMKTGTQHYFYTKRECIIQVHGMGPWGINYVNPTDDPRNKKEMK